MAFVKLSDALNDSANLPKTIKPGAATPIELTDTVWTDLKFSFTQTRQGSNLKPDFDFDNIGLLFPQNNTAEAVYIIAQFPHEKKLGSAIRPHIHWQQSAATGVVWKIDYKWFNNGADVPVSFTTVATTSNAFTYEDGNLAQISSFTEIAAIADENVSSMMLIKLYRDDNTTTGDVLAFEFDIHYQIDALGSKDEFIK